MVLTNKFIDMIVNATWADLFEHRTMETLAPMQNSGGGFGGGQGQASHIAATYAAVLSLALVGSDECLNLIDRRAM